MKTIWNLAQGSFATIGAFIGWFLGGLDGIIYALIAFTVADYVTEVMCAIIKKELSSEIGASGIFKKVLIFMLIGIAHLADIYLLGKGEALRTALIFFYLSNESISLVENAAIIGLPIPKALKDVLAQIRSKPDGGEDDGDK